MTGKPTISVVTPVYNTEKYLAASIESILGQTFADFELILIDDCSKDSSPEIIKHYSDNDPRIISFTNEKNIGCGASKNTGIYFARGTYIAIHDSDDISLPQRLQTQHLYLQQHPELFLLGAGLINVYEDGREEIEKLVLGEDNIRPEMLKRVCVNSPSWFFRNDHKHFFRERFICAEDYDFLLNLMTEGKRFDHLEEPLVRYTIRGNSISNGPNASVALEFADVAREFYFQRLKTGKDGYWSFDPTPIQGKLRKG
jgi:glycosyltransferase involved in cell wall biosynthesis